jgi:hypothetical protein
MSPLVLAALGLPDDSAWPPPDDVLLGVAAGATAAEIESAVLERTAAVRPYQLTLPGDVTEALNRLAAAYDRVTARLAEPAPPPAPAPRTAPAEVFPPPPVPAESRGRLLFRALVTARRRLADWDASGTLLADPDLVALSRAEWVGVTCALRRLADANVLPEDGPGGAVLSLGRSRLGIAALGELSFARRELLRDDWRGGRRILFQAVAEARSRVRPGGWRRTARRAVSRLRGHFSEHLTLVAGGAAVVAAATRVALGN